MEEQVLKNLGRKSFIIRKHILEMLKPPKVGHLGGGASCVEILTVLYFYKMKYKPEEPKWSNRDRFILSKGHAVIALYAVLAEAGYFNTDELTHFKELASHLQGHPDFRRTPGIEANTGSLGQGLSIGVGIALSAKMDKKRFKTYVLLGDGELAEGQVWEAATAAAAYKLDNLIAIVDNNGLQATDSTKNVLELGDIYSKFKSFGWLVYKIDGHDIKQIANILDKVEHVIEKPIAIIAKTIKGKGFGLAENNPCFHNANIPEELYQELIEQYNVYMES